MLYKTNKRKTEGFTIIEVMIVLAIAGLILLIVFLAVPALQRSSRNTQRKNDVSSILGAVSDFASNNAGTLPSAATGATTYGTNTVTFSGGSGDTSGNTETAKVGFYTPANVTVTTTSPGTTWPTTADENHVLIVEGYNCNANNTGIGTATSRTAVALFELESKVKQCQEQ